MGFIEAGIFSNQCYFQHSVNSVAKKKLNQTKCLKLFSRLKIDKMP